MQFDGAVHARASERASEARARTCRDPIFSTDADTPTTPEASASAAAASALTA
jgi:hypothetical protein